MEAEPKSLSNIQPWNSQILKLDRPNIYSTGQQVLVTAWLVLFPSQTVQWVPLSIMLKNKHFCFYGGWSIRFSNDLSAAAIGLCFGGMSYLHDGVCSAAFLIGGMSYLHDVIDKCVGSGLILPACKDHARTVVLVVYFSVFLLLITILYWILLKSFKIVGKTM